MKELQVTRNLPSALPRPGAGVCPGLDGVLARFEFPFFHYDLIAPECQTLLCDYDLEISDPSPHREEPGPEQRLRWSPRGGAQALVGFGGVPGS